MISGLQRENQIFDLPIYKYNTYILGGKERSSSSTTTILHFYILYFLRIRNDIYETSNNYIIL